MPTERGFLLAIADEPDDDSLRLIFADWLEDCDKPHWAALIRRQVGECPADPDGLNEYWCLGRGDRSPTFTGDELALLAAEMAYPVPLEEAVFRRGLVEQLTLPVETILEAGEALVARGPVPMVRLTGVPDHLDRLAGWDAPAGLTRFDLAGADLDDASLLLLVRSRLFAGLRELSLDEAGPQRHQPTPNRLTTAAAGILARAEQLAGLRRLGLGRVPIGDDGLVELSRSPTLRNLTWLSVVDGEITGKAFTQFDSVPWPDLRVLCLAINNLDSEEAEVIATSPQLGPLRRLDLSGTCFPDDATIRLAGSPYPTHLRDLSLHQNNSTSTGFLALTQSPALAGLRRLTFTPSDYREAPGTDLNPEAVAALSRATFADTIESLDLSLEHVGDEGVIGLVESGRLGRLKELFLPHCGIGPAGVRALLDWPAESRVKIRVDGNPMGPDAVELITRQTCRNVPLGQHVMLDLREMNLGDTGLARLAALPDLVRCSYLRADGNGITAVGIAHLASCPAARNLERLWLRSNPIGNAGAKALADSPYFGELRDLILSGCQLGDAGVVALASSPNLPRLEYLDLSEAVFGDAAAFALANWPSPALRTVHFDTFGCGPAAREAFKSRFSDDGLPF